MIYLPVKAQDKVKIQQDGRNGKAEKSALTATQKRKVMKNVNTINVERSKTLKHGRNTCTRYRRTPFALYNCL